MNNNHHIYKAVLLNPNKAPKRRVGQGLDQRYFQRIEDKNEAIRERMQVVISFVSNLFTGK